MLRILGFLALLLIIVAIVGFAAGWFRFSEVEGGERTDITIGFDRDEIERDFAAWKEKVREALDAGGGIEGRFVSADASAREIEVAPAGKDNVRIPLADGAEIVIDEKPAALADLQQGDELEIELADDLQAERITATRGG